MNQYKATRFFAGGLMAGAAIGIAATVYMKVGGVTGAVMFSFGLIAVVMLQLPLFTGQSQFVWNSGKRDYAVLGLMLMLNILGCSLIAALTTNDAIRDSAYKIVQTRIDNGILLNCLLAIPCGFIMTTAVQGAALKKNWLPLLFGVPAFIICGFPHCIADVYYYSATGFTELGFLGTGTVLAAYLPTVVGNFIGCNLYRFVADMPRWFSPAKANQEETKETPSAAKQTADE